MCKLVSSGFGVGAGGDGEIWCKYNVDDGPEESSSGSCGWKESDVMPDGCVPAISFVR